MLARSPLATLPSLLATFTHSPLPCWHPLLVGDAGGWVGDVSGVALLLSQVVGDVSGQVGG
jgi:hypothetical protein